MEQNKSLASSGLLQRIMAIPLGYSELSYQKKKYGVRRSDFNGGQSIKIYAEELGGSDFVSLNYYITSKAESLKPCEMPKQKVIDFLKNYEDIC
ncbi:MAG: peptide methionine sulfoxide reductase [Flavobacteriaceae bacterium]